MAPDDNLHRPLPFTVYGGTPLAREFDMGGVVEPAPAVDSGVRFHDEDPDGHSSVGDADHHLDGDDAAVDLNDRRALTRYLRDCERRDRSLRRRWRGTGAGSRHQWQFAARRSKHRPAPRSGLLERGGVGNTHDDALLREGPVGHVGDRPRPTRDVSTRDRRRRHGHRVDGDRGMRQRFARGPLQGIALLLYVALVPYVVATRWNAATDHPHAVVVRSALVALCLFWGGFLLSTARNVWRLRRGQKVQANGSAWVATLILTLLPFVATPSAGAVTLPHHHSAPAPTHGRSTVPAFAPSASLVPLVLAAKRRADSLRGSDAEPEGDDVDDAVALLRGHDPAVLAALRRAIGESRDGVLDFVATGASTPTSQDPLVVATLGRGERGTLVAFARAGGVLTVLPTWRSNDFVTVLTALHDGRLILAATYSELLRALATRSLTNALVVFTGDDQELDDELRSVCVRVQPTVTLTPALTPSDADGVTVEILRAEPTVRGLDEPFLATLRRRCIEMTAYLALHPHEPVTGDRLRSRVLGGDETDASVRTLANTASAVRRSLGRDAAGPRLHPVTSAGLYTTHGVTSDVTLFHEYVKRARDAGAAGAVHAERALTLIKGEPLATALRGFEWFLAEGHAAALARDAAWASLVVADDALARGNTDMAFWALSQGLLVDVFNDELRARRERLPGLGQLGGNGAHASQNGAVGTGRGVTGAWTSRGLRQ